MGAVLYYFTGSGPGPVVDAPARISPISQVGSPDPHAVHQYNTRHFISKSKRISIHQEMHSKVQYSTCRKSSIVRFGLLTLSFKVEEKDRNSGLFLPYYWWFQ